MVLLNDEYIQLVYSTHIENNTNGNSKYLLIWIITKDFNDFGTYLKIYETKTKEYNKKL